MIPSPDEIAARIAELDAVTKDDYDTFEEWEPEAMERLMLQIAVVHHALRSELWTQALEGLVMASQMCKKVADNAIAQLPHETVVQLVKDKLEVLAQHPMTLEHDFNGVIAFRFDHPVVPDTIDGL